MKQSRKNYIKIAAGVAVFILAFTFLVASMAVSNVLIN